MEAYLFYINQKIDKLRKGPDHGGSLRELRSVQFWRAVFAELLGTFLFHFTGIASVTYWGSSRDEDASIIRISFAFGLAITGVIEIMGPVSGAHLNPAVSLAFAVSRHISPQRAFLYSLAQCGGAIASSAFLFGITPENVARSLGGNKINTEVTVWAALGVEIFYTYFLMTVIYGCTNRFRSMNGLPSLIIGLTVATLQLSGITYSSCSMNPARSLGPAIFSKEDLWTHHWVFWVGPIIGAVLSSLSYKYLIDPYREALSVDAVLEDMGRQHHTNGSGPIVKQDLLCPEKAESTNM